MANIDYSQFPSYYNTQQKKRALINHVKEGKVTIEDLRTGETDAIYKEWLSQVEQLLKEELKNGWIPPVNSFPAYYCNPDTMDMLRQHIKEGKVSLSDMQKAGLDKSHTGWFNDIAGISVTPPPTVTEPPVDESEPKPKKEKKSKAKTILLVASLLLLVASVIAGFVMHSNLTDEIYSLSHDVDSLYVANNHLSQQNNNLRVEYDTLFSTCDALREQLTTARDQNNRLTTRNHYSDSVSNSQISNLRSENDKYRNRLACITRNQSIVVTKVSFNRESDIVTLEYKGLVYDPSADLHIEVQQYSNWRNKEWYGPIHEEKLNINYVYENVSTTNSYSFNVQPYYRKFVNRGKDFRVVIKQYKNNTWTTLWTSGRWSRR